MKITSQKRLPEKSKALKALGGLLVLCATLLVFYLDVITGDEVAFYIFYIPSIMALTWYWGNRTGWLMVVLSSLMWLIAQWNLPFLFINSIVRTLTFAVVCVMTGMIRNKEEQLQIKSNELARSNQELELFAAKAAHDLQSPLATILGFAELLRDKYRDSDDEAKDFTDRIIGTVNRTIVFIRALLNYASVKKPETSQPPLALEKVVKEVIKDFHFLILQKKAEVICNPLPVLSINPGLAGLLFQNLIGNAMKYCEREPRIHISAVRKGKEWLFSIQDNGIGIPEEFRERVFLMFEKLATRQKYPGSGIGLATCQKIVERYGGRIWVESPPKSTTDPSGSAAGVQDSAAGKSGTGSAFFFTLPAV
ncbi:MAG: ATP-binding protein [Candidatus Omnitrophota bacterium]